MEWMNKQENTIFSVHEENIKHNFPVKIPTNPLNNFWKTICKKHIELEEENNERLTLQLGVVPRRMKDVIQRGMRTIIQVLRRKSKNQINYF